MKTKPVLTTEQALKGVEAARNEARTNQWNVAIVVVDDGGHPLALERSDDCAPVASYIATEKARTAAIGRRSTKQYEDMINNGRIAFLSAPIEGALQGGIPLVIDGQTVGAIGVSGVKPDQDAQIAEVGIATMQS